MMTIWQKLFDETTFHGIWHGTRPEKFWNRVVWIIINFALLLGLLLSLISLILNYDRNSQVASFGSAKKSDWRFPDVVICPNFWIDGEKETELSNDLLQYSLGFLGILAHESELRAQNEQLKYFDLNKIGELKEQFHQAMLNHSSLTSMLKNISKDQDKVFVTSNCNGCAVPSYTSKLVKSSQVCYQMVFSAGDFSQKLTFSLFPNIQESSSTNFAQVLVGNLAKYEHQANFLMLNRQFSYDITLLPQIYKTCDSKNDGPPLTCEQQCLLKKESSAGGDAKYFMGELWDRNGQFYIHSSDRSWFLGSKIDLLDTQSCRNSSCASEGCEYAVYQFSVIAYPFASQGRNEIPSITLRLPAGQQTILFEAHHKESYASLLGNIGGLLALFFGASISSFLHLLFFISCCKCHCPWMSTKVSSKATENFPFHVDGNAEAPETADVDNETGKEMTPGDNPV